MTDEAKQPTAKEMMATAKPSPGGRRATAQKRAARPRAGSKEYQAKVDEVKASSEAAIEAAAEQDSTKQAWAEAMRIDPGLLMEYDGMAAQVFTPNVHQLWSRVMESVRSVAKGDYNKDQKFHFRGVDAVIDKVGPALRAYGVHVRPRRIISTTATEYSSKSGNRMVNRVMHVEWEVTGPQGDSFVGESMGEAADSSDKSTAKAQSVAYRVFLLQALCIPTGDDPDFETHERATRAEAEGYGRQRPTQPQRGPSQDERRQAQAGEENQAAQPDNEDARKEMWRTAKQLGWEWGPLAARFRSDYGTETSQSDAATIEAFTSILLKEAEAEEDRAKAVVQEELGGKEVQPDEAQSGGHF